MHAAAGLALCTQAHIKTEPSEEELLHAVPPPRKCISTPRGLWEGNDSTQHLREQAVSLSCNNTTVANDNTF